MQCYQVEPETRGPVGDALAAYASISDKQLLSGLYRVTLQKYQKVRTSKAAAPWRFMSLCFKLIIAASCIKW